MKNIVFLLAILFQAHLGFTQGPTWSSDIARIIYANCTPCHHNGGLAPSSFMSYQEVFPYAGGISYAVSNDIMPPWPADENYKRYAHDMVLTQQEINAIQQWVSNGRPQGNMYTAPAPPEYNNTTQLGTVDLSLQMQNYTITSNGDVYRNFVLNTGLTQTRYATAMEVIPGNTEIVHHVLVFMDTSNNAINPNSQGGTGSNASKFIYGYVPGAQPYIAPPGTGFRFPPNTRIILQMHYAPGSLNLTDATTINFKLTATPQRNISANALLNHFTSLTNGPLSIPANTTRTFNEQAAVPTNLTMLYAWPHMHMVGRSIKSFATTSIPNDTIRFVNIPDWDFHWQQNYVFTNPIKVPTGSTLRATAFYDNTTNNPSNPNSPPQNVTAGEGSGDEMMMVFFAYMPYQNGDENLIVDKRLFARSGTTFCNGQSVLLETIEGNGYTYKWYRDGNLINNAISFSYIATQSGNYTVSLTLGNNSVTSDTVVVTVNPSPVATITPSGSTTLCNNSVTLNAATGSGYSYRWFRDGTLISNASSSSYTTNMPGNYTVEVFNGCYALSSPIAVTSASSSAVITPNGATSFCSGDEVTLTANSGNSYLWSNGATSQSITVNSSSNYSVTVINSGCSATTSQQVSVSPLPTPNFSYTATGNTVTFNNFSSDATSYSWDFGDGASDNSQNPTHTYASSGTYTVILTAQSPCGANTYSIDVNLNCSPVSVNIVASGNTEFCSGGSVELTSSITSATSFQWVKDGIVMPNEESNTINVVSGGSYTLNVFDQNNCPGTSSAIEIIVNQNPSKPTINQLGNTLESSAADNYEWYLDGVLLQSETTQQINISQNGCYEVKVIDNNGCSEISDTLCAYITSNIVDFENNILITPNPFHNGLLIDLNSLTDNATIVCYDVTGRIMFKQNLNEKITSINTKEISNGIYFVVVYHENKQPLAKKKIVKYSK